LLRFAASSLLTWRRKTLNYIKLNNIKMDIKRDRMGWYGLDWSGSG
jgi:hypothetical protein